MTSIAKKRNGKSKKAMNKKSPRRSIKKARKAASKKVKKAGNSSKRNQKSENNSNKKRVSFNESLNTAKTFDKNASLGNSEQKTIEENTAPEISGQIPDVSGDEKLSIMSRKDRKDYIQKLKAKKKPNYELSKKKHFEAEIFKTSKIPPILQPNLAVIDFSMIFSNKKLTLEEKNKIIDELYGLVEGKAKQLIFAHDTVRVLQCLMALKSPQIRTKLFDELKDHVLEMTKSKYSKFFVVKMLKYGTPDQRAHILKCFSGKIVDLIKHPVACDVVEYLYNDYAQALQRSQICAEFYASEYQFFQINEVVSLKDIIVKHPEKKNSIKDYLSQIILSLANKPAMRHSLLHKICWDFLENFGDDENLRKEIIDAIKDRIPEILHTKDGSHCAVYCIWHGDVKERKSIVKSLKGLVLKTCTDEFGHQILLAIFDTVDDTVVVNKIIIQEMNSNLDAIMKSHYGMRTVLYLLNTRDTKHFNKDQIAFLASGDNNSIRNDLKIFENS
uniref:PUM-HD domain-containing protein n=1 Tax=Romanomermis culicivorax TaxID=13658 RepID=A0A915HZE1_ROMCU